MMFLDNKSISVASEGNEKRDVGDNERKMRVGASLH